MQVRHKSVTCTKIVLLLDSMKTKKPSLDKTLFF